MVYRPFTALSERVHYLMTKEESKFYGVNNSANVIDAPLLVNKNQPASATLVWFCVYGCTVCLRNNW